MPLIRIRGLTKLYRMGESVVHALDGVDLDIEPGEFVAITGASGSGKSTMMHVVGCLDRPTSGSYVFDGADVSTFSDRQLAEVRNRRIGFVFQTFNLINRTSAIDNVAVPLFYARRTNVRAAARRALERVGLIKRATHRSNELSGGERQRVAIARAIVGDPLLLLADEPTGNLDSRTGEQIMQIFHDLNAQGVTIVLVTHEHDVAVQARRIVNMRDGKVISDRAVTAEERREVLERARSSAAASPEEHGAAGGKAPLSSSATPSPGPLSPGATPWSGPPSSSPSSSPSSGRPSSLPPRPDGPPPPGGSGSPRRPLPAGARPVRPRIVAGATGSLVCALIAPLLAVGATLGVRGIAGLAPLQKAGLTQEFMFLTLGVLAAFGVAMALGIVAIVLGRGALRRLKQEPAAVQTGAGRARAGMVLGTLAVFSPLLCAAVTRIVGLGVAAS